MTLEQCHEEEDNSGQDSEHHGHVDDPTVESSGRDSQEEESNGHLRDDHAEGVEEVAEPPAL